MSEYHIPVLLEESVAGLNINPEGTYVDVTFGGGGHSREILSRLEAGKLVAFDQDPDAQANLPDDDRLIFLRQNFRFLRNNLRYQGINEVDGILADLGVSSHQFDEGERGFSYRMDAVLDMRMNPAAGFSARRLVAEYSAQDLQKVFSLYGEIRNSRTLAEKICSYRKSNEIVRISDLVEAMGSAVPARGDYKYLSRVFQAMRIEVNAEMEGLEAMLKQAARVLKPGGRLVVISYHSLEDRMVKNLIKFGDFEKKESTDLYGRRDLLFSAVNRKPILPAEEETEKNPRARSAKLRIGERL